jgi:catechol 2,3-dioxygenase-like lactoylglutathione lyase family enzyme
MKLKYSYTRLHVENYSKSKEFYQKVLGFEVLYADDSQEYAELATGATTIKLLNRDRLPEFIGLAEKATYDNHNAKIALTFTVANLDEEIAELKRNGIAMVNNPWQRPQDELMQAGVLTACFRDPDGNLIELIQLLS